MFEYLAEFRTIVITGPQRSGTRIAAKMIAEDTGKEFIDERDISIDSLYLFFAAVKNGGVIQAPALCRYAHIFGNYDDYAVVMMKRPIPDIVASQDRIGWTQEWEHIELAYYDQTKGPIAEVKYAFWKEQKKVVKNDFEVEYRNLCWHPLWIPQRERAEFTPHQTELA